MFGSLIWQPCMCDSLALAIEVVDPAPTMVQQYWTWSGYKWCCSRSHQCWTSGKHVHGEGLPLLSIRSPTLNVWRNDPPIMLNKRLADGVAVEAFIIIRKQLRTLQFSMPKSWRSHIDTLGKILWVQRSNREKTSPESTNHLKSVNHTKNERGRIVDHIQKPSVCRH